MDRTTVMLPGSLKEKSTRLARRLGVSFGELVRTALAQAVSRAKQSHPETEDSLFCDRQVYQGVLPKDLSANHDKYLYEE